MITDISDDEASARKVADWVLTDLDSTVPTHFVRFHPDYKMINTVRTPIPRLERAREIALEMGLQHVYLGNVYDTPYSNTFCRSCNSTLVTRYGLNAQNVGLNEQGHCQKCGLDAHFKLMPPNTPRVTVNEVPLEELNVKTVEWHGDIRSAHVQVRNTNDVPANIYHRRRHASDEKENWTVVTLNPGESYRFILAKSSLDEVGPEVAIPPGVESNLHEVFDRAHFPTLAIEEIGVSKRDIAPLPLYPGTLQANMPR
jgi:pyruvate formate lyase activating enzyme